MGGGGGFIGDIVGGVGDIVGGIGDAVGDVVSGVGDVLDGAVEIVSDAGSAVDDFVNEEIPGGWGTVAVVAGGAALASGALGGTAAGAAGTGAGTAAGTGLTAGGLGTTGLTAGTAAGGIGGGALGTGLSTTVAGGGLSSVGGLTGLLGAGETLVGAGLGLTAAGAGAPGLASMGGGTGLLASVPGGVVGETGLTATGAVPILGDAGSFINNPAVLGTDVIGAAPGQTWSVTDALRAANTINNVLGGGQQPTMGTAGGSTFGDILGQVGQGVSGLFSSFAPSTTAAGIGAALLEGLGTQDIINRLQNLGTTSQQQYQNLAQQATEGLQFTPYGVTTSLFGTTPTEGGITSTLTGQGQQLSDAALQAALSSYQQAGTADLGQMAQERMGLYQQLVGPEQERARLAAEARLAAQGRLGIGAGGGEYAPELRALQDAIAKQNLQFALQAPQEALAQRASLIQQGAGAAAIPTGLAGQQLQAGQLGGTLGQQAASAAAQRGQLLGTIAGQGISENLLANIAAGQVAAERNKALATAIQGALGTGTTQQQSQNQTTTNYLASLGIGGGGGGGLISSPGFGGNLLSDLNTINQGVQAGQAIYNAGSSLFSGLGSLFNSGATQNPVTSANSTSFPLGVPVTPENYDAYFGTQPVISSSLIQPAPGVFDMGELPIASVGGAGDYGMFPNLTPMPSTGGSGLLYSSLIQPAPNVFNMGTGAAATGPVIVDPQTGKQFTVGGAMDASLNTSQAYQRALAAAGIQGGISSSSKVIV